MARIARAKTKAAAAAERRAKRAAATKKAEDDLDFTIDQLSHGLVRRKLRRLLVDGLQKIDPKGKLLPPEPPRCATKRQADQLITRAFLQLAVDQKRDQPFEGVRLRAIAFETLAQNVANGKATAVESGIDRLIEQNVLEQSHEQRIAISNELLGKVPLDPTLGVHFVQRGMLNAFKEVFESPNIDLLTRTRVLADVGAKVGVTFNKADLGAKAEELRGLLSGPEEQSADELTSTDGTKWPATSRFASRNTGDASLPGDVTPVPPKVEP